MKLLVVADHEAEELWDNWSEETADSLSDVGLILSAGDLYVNYLEFLVTMLNVPLLYVLGNHDESYLTQPPEGCMDVDGKVIDIHTGEAAGTIRIFGLGGSMRYKEDAPCMYSEKEMEKRLKELKKTARRDRFRGKGKRRIDIFLTHAPCKGFGDLQDLPHRGFSCFHDVLGSHQPRFHIYGHVHKGYGENYSDQGGDDRHLTGFRRVLHHPSGTTLINADGYYVLDF